MRLAVVSPFLDRQHGTELCITEQIERLAGTHHWQVDLYSQRVAQLDTLRTTTAQSESSEGGIFWHKVSLIPGPHLLKYIWWFLANHWVRWKDRRSGQVLTDLVYTPGINCLDADVIAVHIVFHAFYERVKPELALRRVPLRAWPRVIHRKLYYRLIMVLESKIYRGDRVRLIAVSTVVANQLHRFFGRKDVLVIPNATDSSRFNPAARSGRQTESRQNFGFADTDFVVLLIGNDWKKKGLDCLLRAAALLRDLPLRVLVVGADDAGIYRADIAELGLEDRVRFEQPSPDVLRFYAAADLYAAPSLEDAFNLPVLEAMACGLPVVASASAGVTEYLQHGTNGFVLQDARDAAALSNLLRRLWTDRELRQRMSAAASATTSQWTWDKNTSQLADFLTGARKSVLGPKRP